MKRFTGYLVVLACALAMASCSATQQAQFDTGFRNLTAVQCDNQAATLANLPLGFLSTAQAGQILATVCATMFGTSPAPTPAPGNNPVFGGPTPAPTPAK